jgi:ABC-2 type transport system permease protein
MLLGAAGVAQGTAIGVSMDVTGGIFARFRTMAIAPVSILGGHVIAATLQTLLTMGVTLGVAVLLGFRPGAGPLDWIGLFGVLVLVSLALTWLTVALGIGAKTIESASNSPMVFMLLPFLSSGFVPVETMPTAVRWFAEYQPFTPITDVVRGLLDGAAPGASTVALAVGWCAVLGLVGYVWARAGYRRERSV